MFDPAAIGTTIIGLRADRDGLDVASNVDRIAGRAPRRHGIRQQSAVILARLLPHWVGSRRRARESRA